MTDETDKKTAKTTAKTTETGSDASDTTTTTKVGKRQLPQMNIDAKRIRTMIAQIIWVVCVFFAVVLAAEVLLIAIEANESNDLVTFMRETADKVDLGLFDLSDPIKDFNENDPSDTGTVLFNYGLAAVAWLVIGKIADAVIRP
ncbi:hypothetical protein BH09ACT12_BH09ACT12_16750 [soil metagenome]